MSATSMQKGGDVERVEHVRARNGGGWKRHCARRWWVYLIVTLAVILAVVLGLIFGVLPAIAQKTINESKLTVDGISITEPQPESFTYSQNATVTGHVPVKAHLNPQRIAMFLEPAKGEEFKPFMYLNVSQLDLADSFPINVADYPMEIADKDAFVEFTKLALSVDSFRLALRSRPELASGSLRNFVDYNKVVDLKGFNGLKGAKIYGSKLLNESMEDGTNMLATLYVNNTSSFEMEVGDLTANFKASGLALGYGVVKNLRLVRGENRVQVNGHLLEALAKNAESTQGLLDLGMKITISGNSTVYNGKHIPWLEAALGALPLDAEVLPKGKTI
jgi:hypothetical protein